jgi:type II secretory pathway pseudopilin PulG
MRFQDSKFKSRNSAFCYSKSDLPPAFTGARASAGGFRNHCGFSYIALLAAIVIIGISLGAAGKYWSSVLLRDKEEELLFRGDQYRQAIERYYLAIPGRLEYPSSIDDLLMDNRSAAGKRHLRQKYKDPISGEDFVEVRSSLTKRIIGVHSPSEKQPFKQTNFLSIYSNKVSAPQPGFPIIYNSFVEKSRYSEWVFVTTILPATSAQPAGFRPLKDIFHR